MTEPTISINGGPDVPVSVAKKALKVVIDANQKKIDDIIQKEGERVDAIKKAQLPLEGETQDVENVSGQRLKSYLDRIERLEEEKKGLADDVKDIYAEAKGVGFDTKTIRTLVRLRKMDTNKRHEEEELLELYKSAVGLD